MQIVNAEGSVVGVFVSPVVETNGIEAPALFSLDGDFLTVRAAELPDPVAESKSCTRATVGKWTYRVTGGLTCGALGASTGVGGVLCGLGTAGLEDRIPFDNVC